MTNTSKHTFTCSDGTQIPIAWRQSSRNRNIRLTIHSGGIRVSSPPRAPWKLIAQFLSSQEAWLLAHWSKHAETKKNTLLYQGYEYSLSVQSDVQPAQRVTLGDQTCYLAPLHNTPESAKQTLERWLKAQAAELLTPIFLESRESMNIQADQLRWRDTRSRWGSCSSNGQIMLSWRLIHAPVEIARYVIIHELAHRIHHDHSSRFWALVAEYDPAYQLHRGWLKRHGHLCQSPAFDSL
jgi:predicted metal-dependent hydrolase